MQVDYSQKLVTFHIAPVFTRLKDIRVEFAF